VPPTRKTAELMVRDERILQMAAEGYSQREIGATLGVSGARINQILKELREDATDDGMRDRLDQISDMLLRRAVALATGRGKRLVAANGKPVYEMDPVVTDSRGQPVPDLTKPLYDEYSTLDAMMVAVKIMERKHIAYGLNKKPKDKDESAEFEEMMEYVRQLAARNKEIMNKNEELKHRLAQYEGEEILEAELVPDSTEGAGQIASPAG
jgi:hypothetical protein